LSANVIGNDAQAIATARELAAEFAAYAAARDLNRELPHEQVAEFYRSGLGAVIIPREYGGTGVSAATIAEIFATISAADPSLGQIPQNHTAFLELLRYSGDEPQKRKFFALALQGASFGNALAERHGKTTKDISTKLTRRGEDYVLNGHKFYATGALFSTFVPIGAVDDDGRIYRVVVPRNAPGLTIIDDWNGMGQRTTASGTVTLENVFIPADHVIQVHQFAASPNLYGATSQIIQAAIDLGIARAAGWIAARTPRPKTRSSSRKSASWKFRSTPPKPCWSVPARRLMRAAWRLMPPPRPKAQSPWPRQRF
jgi:alkylation response protein AidB-like acyl-CoA dehydrogenase